jgi:hypothetical protein
MLNGKFKKKLQEYSIFPCYFCIIETGRFLSRGAEGFLPKAEIKPVEPEQGNSCEGKVSVFFIALSCLHFPVPKFFNRIKKCK